MYFLISNPEANLFTMAGANGMARESSDRADPRGTASFKKSCDHAQVSVVVSTFASKAAHKKLGATSLCH